LSVTDLERARYKRYREKNREKINARRRKNYQENKEFFRAKSQKYKEENKEKVRAYDKKYKEENKELIAIRKKEYAKKYYLATKETRREARREANKIYRDSHREKIRRDAKLRKVWRSNYFRQHRKTKWFTSEKHKIRLMYVKAKEFGFHVDHIVPLRSDKVCGLHTWANLQLLAPELNKSKGNHHWPDMPTPE